MKQSQIDQLLMSSDEENQAKKKKKVSKKQLEEDDYYDQFFQSQNVENNPKKGTKHSIKDTGKDKDSGKDKGVGKDKDKGTGSLKKLQQKGKQQSRNKEKQKVNEPQQEQEYLNESDFESQVSQGDQKFNPITKPKAEPVKPVPQVINKKKQPQPQPQEQENYQVQDAFQEEIIQTSRRSIKSKISKAQSEDLVKSQYTQSRAQQQQIQEMADNMDQEIQTVKSSKIKSQLLNDDEMSEAQSEYIESTRMNHQQFRRKSDLKEDGKNKDDGNAKKGVDKNKLEKDKGALAHNNNLNMKKKKPEPQPITAHKKDSIPSKKSIPENKKSQPDTKKPSQKNTLDLNPKNKLSNNISKARSKNQEKEENQEQEDEEEPKPKKNVSKNTPSYMNKIGTKKKNDQDQNEEVSLTIEERQANIAELQARKKELQERREAKKRQEQQKAKQQYEQAKKKHQEEQEKKKKILQEQRKQKKLDETLPKNGKRTVLQKEQLDLTESKIKQLAEKEQNKKQEKAKMQIAEDMKKRRKEEERQIKEKLQQQNEAKLRRLKQESEGYMDRRKIEKDELEEKTRMAKKLKEEKRENKNYEKERLNERKQVDAPQIRKLKQEIAQIKEKLKEKEEALSSLDDYIKELRKEKKDKELQDINQGEELEKIANGGSASVNIMGIGGSESYLESQLTPVERFVRLFDECNSTAQIFTLIDEDKDQFVSLDELKAKVTQILINKQLALDQSRFYHYDEEDAQQHQQRLRQNIKENSGVETLIQEVFAVLDNNSDGNVTKEQFTFIIQGQIKKAKEYRKLTNNLSFTNPIDIEASILDMKEKIKYMNKKSLEQLNNNRIQQLQQKYQKYLSKHQQYEKRYIYGKSNTKNKQKLKSQKEQAELQADINNDRQYFLTQEVIKLRAQKANEQKMLQKIRVKQEENIKEKNLELTEKVQQNIKLSEEIYKVNQLIEEYQLRFLSKAKIQENRYRYMAKKSEQKQLYQEAIQRAKEYQTKILNPTKEIKFGTYANQVKYLAAVIMIQRNFRMRKAMREKENRLEEKNRAIR